MKATDQRQEHTGSYYAASVNEVTDYPELEGAKSVDICVVGAGFTGVSTALTLAERGYSVALVEANRIGWGASGRNGGQIINGMSGLAKLRKKYGDGIADMLWDLRWRGNEREMCGGDPDTTNNRMELMAAIVSLESLKRTVKARLHTDSTYVKDGITKWIINWKKKGWKTANRKPVKNMDLWQRLDEAAYRLAGAGVSARGNGGSLGPTTRSRRRPRASTPSPGSTCSRRSACRRGSRRARRPRGP